jgi:hypothetical protein
MLAAQGDRKHIRVRIGSRSPSRERRELRFYIPSLPLDHRARAN